MLDKIGQDLDALCLVCHLCASSYGCGGACTICDSRMRLLMATTETKTKMLEGPDKLQEPDKLEEIAQGAATWRRTSALTTVLLNPMMVQSCRKQGGCPSYPTGRVCDDLRRISLPRQRTCLFSVPHAFIEGSFEDSIYQTAGNKRAHKEKQHRGGIVLSRLGTGHQYQLSQDTCLWSAGGGLCCFVDDNDTERV